VSERSKCEDVTRLVPGQAVWVKTHVLHQWKWGVVQKVGRTRVLVKFAQRGGRPERERWFYAEEVQLDRSAAEPPPATAPAITTGGAAPLADGTCIHGLSGPCPECEVAQEVVA
jgi:hypothetical protein